MPLIRTEKQKDNLAKFLYDIAKIVVAIAVIGPAVSLSVFSYAAMLGGWRSPARLLCSHTISTERRQSHEPG